MKKVYTIEGLDCANCAAKLERKLNEHPLVEEAVITFATQQLRITAQNPDGLLAELQQIAENMEDGVIIRKRVRGKKRDGEQHHKHSHQHGENCGCGEHHHEHSHNHEENCGCGEHHHHEHSHNHEENCGCGEHHHHEHSHNHGENCGCGEHHHKHEHSHNHGENCGCKEHHHEHSHNQAESLSHEGKKKKPSLSDMQKNILKLGAGILAFVAALLCEKAWQQETASFIFYFLAYCFLGGEIVLKAIKNIVKGKVFDENFLMSLATVGAFIIGEYAEAVGVMLFYQIGELFEEVAVNKSRKQIMDAVDMRAETVKLCTPNGVLVVDIEDVQVGDVILVRPGDRIPLDGTVIEGNSRVDTSPITGEPVPVTVAPESAVVSGCVNETGVIQIRVEKELEESMVTRILDSVENAAASKPQIDRFITRFARVYTPFVVVLAVLTAIIPSLITGNWEHWIYTALTFLVISCPCALVLSVPLAFFAGIGAGSKRGILIKGGVSLEAMDKVKVVAMDKTGTITEGNFVVQQIGTADGTTKEQLLAYAAACEQHSTHPIAMSIMELVKKENLKTTAQTVSSDCVGVQDLEPEQLYEIAGKGIRAVIHGKTVLCGNRSLLEQEGINLQEYKAMTKDSLLAGSEVLVAADGQFMGFFHIADTVKADSKEAILKMKKQGLVTVMLTGDTEESASYVASETGVDKVYAKLLPEDKCNCLSEVRKEQGSVMFIGDGINDAPVLAGADVGAAMGSGADAALEAADVVFMNSSLTAVLEALRIAKTSLRVSKQNVIFALGIKAFVMILGLCGIASMWMAVFADSGVAMLCVMNSVKILYDTRGKRS